MGFPWVERVFSYDFLIFSNFSFSKYEFLNFSSAYKYRGSAGSRLNYNAPEQSNLENIWKKTLEFKMKQISKLDYIATIVD